MWLDHAGKSAVRGDDADGLGILHDERKLGDGLARVERDGDRTFGHDGEIDCGPADAVGREQSDAFAGLDAFFIWLELVARIMDGPLLGWVLIGYTVVTLVVGDTRPGRTRTVGRGVVMGAPSMVAPIVVALPARTPVKGAAYTPNTLRLYLN